MGIKTNLLPERARLESGDSFLVDAAAGTGRLTIGAAQNQLTRNRNLLDNWYLADPINQRKGYIVNSGVTYYSDAELTTSAGTTTAAMTAQYVDSTYGTIVISGITYYVAAADMARGYVRAGYTIDRWRMYGNIDVLTLMNGHINMKINGLGGGLSQQFEFPTHLNGLTLTLSVLYRSRSGGVRFYFRCVENEFYQSISLIPDGEWHIGSVTFVCPGISADSVFTQVACYNYQDNVADFDLTGIKLELGSVQTLAHQDVSGNWVLNDPQPNKALELAKCQRYQLVLPGSNSIYASIGLGSSYSSKSVQTSIATPVTMRARPTIKMQGVWFIRGEGVTISFDAGNIKYGCDNYSANCVDLWMDFTEAENIHKNQIYELIRDKNTEAMLLLDANL